MSLPGISVLVPTYGRTHLLGEVVESYRRQDWGGPSELVIYNDLREQFLSVKVDLPPNKKIRVYNAEKRDSTLGDKRNNMLGMSQYPIVTYWDDDDIYLPHRLSLSFILMHSYTDGVVTPRPATREYKEWHLYDNGVMILRFARPFGTMTCLKSVIQEVGGFPSLERLQDVALTNKLVRAKKLSNLPQVDWIPSTIYRLHSHLKGGHVSDVLLKVISEEQEYENNEIIRSHMIASTSARLALGEEPTGEVEIHSRWDRNYLEMAQEAWKVQKPS